MFIAHAPAGFIYGHLLAKLPVAKQLNKKALYACCILGSLAPDLDLLYFYFSDHRQYNHHTYWSHLPIAWLLMVIFACFVQRLDRYKCLAWYFILFTSSAFFHLLLDTVVGDIWWLVPIYNKPFSLITVPAVYSPWWLNFIFHWTFAFEVFIVAGALVLVFQKRSPNSAS